MSVYDSCIVLGGVFEGECAKQEGKNGDFLEDRREEI